MSTTDAEAGLLPSHAPLPHSWGRIASVGAEEFVPSPNNAELMWDRTQRLSLAFDSQGVANMLVGGQCGTGIACPFMVLLAVDRQPNNMCSRAGREVVADAEHALAEQSASGHRSLTSHLPPSTCSPAVGVRPAGQAARPRLSLTHGCAGEQGRRCFSCHLHRNGCCPVLQRSRAHSSSINRRPRWHLSWRAWHHPSLCRWVG